MTGEAGPGLYYPDSEDDEKPWDWQSTTACCPRETIPDSCSCPDGCACWCRDCDCGRDDEPWVT